MPRQGRINIEGGIYHVIQRGIERKEIFKEDSDCREFLSRLQEGLKQTKHKCYGWVLMPNHFHLLIRTSAKPLSDLMRKLLTGYALYFNKKYKRGGYLYQNRYKSILCQEDEYLLELVRYIHLNPLRAKIVKDIDGLNSYPWSGHAVIIGRIKFDWQSTDEVLSYFSNRKDDAIRKYVEFITQAKDTGRKDALTGGGLIRSVGGWSELAFLRKIKQYRCSDERVLGDGEFVSKILKTVEEDINRRQKLLKEGWNLNKIEKRTCELFKLKEGELHNRSRLNAVSKARKVFMFFAKKELGLTGADIARYLNITEAAISKGIKEGEGIAELDSLKLIS